MFSYDDIGNIVAKADVGIYSYLPSGAGSVRPHAVSQITGTVAGLTNPGFSYDANGNLLNGLGRAYGWNAANLPLRIDKLSSGAPVERTEFVYGPSRERAQQLVRPVSAGVPGSPSRIVRYAGAIEKEIDYAQNKTTIRTALPLNLGFYEQVVNDTANVPTATPAQAMQRYYHSDAQGSLNVVTDGAGAVLQRMNYDAWGRRRNVNGSDDAWTSLGSPGLWNAYGDRGYTGHDQIDQLGLVHYDPIVGRMTSADPTVPDATDVQAFNRYSYVLNNALKYVDPTGFEPEDPDANPHVHTGNQKKFLFTGSRIARETAPPGTKGVGAGDPVAAKGMSGGGARLDTVQGQLQGIARAFQNNSRLDGVDHSFEEVRKFIVQPQGLCAQPPGCAMGTLPVGGVANGVKPFEVGRFDRLEKLSNVGDDLALHHAGQRRGGAWRTTSSAAF